MELEIQLLGPFVADYGGQPLDSFRSNKTQALLAYLVTEQGFADAKKGRAHSHTREKLMALLWPRAPQKSAQVNLRQTLYQLRQAIPEVAGGGDPVPFLLSDRQTIQVNPDARYRLDVARFLLSGALLAADPSPDELAESVALYRGPFLSDFHLPDSETFEEWAAGRRATLQRMALEALEALAEHHMQQAEPEQAERYARRQLALDNLRESGHRQLMRALGQQGKRNAALAHYDEYCALLWEELGVEPSAEIQAAYEAVREGQGEVTSVPAPDVHSQLRTREKARLPSPPTPFVGRRREIAEITGMLEDGCRLLTLLGPGGSGKTRLALEVAPRRADKYADGAAFVKLAPLSDPANIPTAIANALNFRFTAEGTPREQMLNYLANKEMLLVLDNLEHLLDKHLFDRHLPDGADFVDELLRSAPGVGLIATSRLRLNLGAECLFEVGGLATRETGSAEAVEMFVTYARRVHAGFDPDEKGKQAIIRICRLVEGMPLAIELAASWVRILPPQEIARKLAEDVDFLESARTDLPERQRSMRAAFDYSWNMLDESEQAALTKLSVFRGGASRKAAIAVSGASLRTLVVLADHSLLSRDPDSGRVSVHELIRQFAGERLEEAGNAETVRDAHSAYYLRALAERLPDLKGRDQLDASDAIEEDFENVRAAWRWAIRRGRWQHFPEASQSLYLFALFRNRHLDSIELFEAARRAIRSRSNTTERLAHAYAFAGEHGSRHWSRFWRLQEGALAEVPEMQTALQELDDPAAVAYCKMMAGQTIISEGQAGEIPAEATEALEAACAYYRQAQDPFYGAMALWRLGQAHLPRRREEALNLYRRALSLAREAGDRFVASALLHNLGAKTWDVEGPTEAVETYLREAIKLCREMNAQTGYAFSLAHLAQVRLWREGDLAKSRRMLEEAHAIYAEQNLRRATVLIRFAAHRLVEGEYEKVLALTEETLAREENYAWGWYWPTMQRGVAFFALGEVDEAVPLMKRALSRALAVSHVAWVGACLAYCSAVMARRGKHERAAELLALGLTGPHGAGLELDPLLRRTRAKLEQELGAESFATAWERGKELNAPAVAQDVLEWLEAAGAR